MERRLFDGNIYHRLPEGLKSVTELFDGREKDIVLISSVTVLSNCFPNVAGFYDGDVVYPHLYSVIVAPPAAGKGVMNHARILINQIHETVFKNSLHEYQLCAEKLKPKQSDKSCPPIKIKILLEFYNYLIYNKD